MALTAKPVTASAPTTVASPRGPVTSARSPVATFAGSAVEAAAPVFGATIEDAGSTIVGQEGESRFGHQYSPAYRDDRETPTPHTGVLDTPSQSFVSMLELRDTFDASQVIGESAAKKLVGQMVGKAVAIYESNVQVAAGETPTRGESVSLTL